MLVAYCGSTDLLSMAIDYSEWDNINTDSEPEVSPPPVPVPGVIPTAAPVPHSQLLEDPMQHIARQGPSKPSSSACALVPGLIEVPLVFHRVGTQSANRADVDNQIVTYLNIDDETGFAPPEWRSDVGTVIVARKDKKVVAAPPSGGRMDVL
ncbi:hypothetical protein DL771_006809 [Monosporascus sp. 5C6A]|nr:hypothetical protein DL771_006809 [Monosporascus sp. 5C6A]